MAKTKENILIPRRYRLHCDHHIVSSLCCGPLEGKAVVFLHGIPTSAEIWRPMLLYFAQHHYRTYAIDLPGFGKTHTNSPEGASWNVSLQMIKEWCIRANLTDIWWVGHQAGCSLAMACARTMPERTQRVSLITPLLKGDSLWPTWALRWMDKTIGWGIYHQVVRYKLLPNLFFRKRLAQQLHHIKRLDVFADRKILFNDKVTNPTRRSEFIHFVHRLPHISQLEISAQIHSVNCPVQLITPAILKTPRWRLLQARLTRKPITDTGYYEVISKLIAPHTQVIGMKDCNILAPLEAPKALAEAILMWANPELRASFSATSSTADSYVTSKPNSGYRINTSINLPPDGSPAENSPIPVAVVKTPPP